MSRTLTFSGEGTVTINGTAVTSPANISTGDVIVAAATHAGPDRTPASASVTISYDGQTQLLTADEEQGIWSATQTYNITAGDIDIAFSSNSGEVSAIATINYTEKVSKTVDLTTLTGWANLSDGEHTITIKAKADGYRDSQASEGVSVTKGSTGETWVLNEVPLNPSTDIIVDINFTSNNTQYNSIMINKMPAWSFDAMAYDSEHVYTGSNGWSNTAYRTITFATAPTGDLLTWLQANGTKQGGGVTSGYTVTINYDNQTNLSKSECSGIAYYSLDNGQTWIDLVEGVEQVAHGVSQQIENVVQIMFKVVAKAGGYYAYTLLNSATGDFVGLAIFSNSNTPQATSNNYVLTQDSSVTFVYLD